MINTSILTTLSGVMKWKSFSKAISSLFPTLRMCKVAKRCFKQGWQWENRQNSERSSIIREAGGERREKELSVQPSFVCGSMWLSLLVQLLNPLQSQRSLSLPWWTNTGSTSVIISTATSTKKSFCSPHSSYASRPFYGNEITQN